MSLPCLVGTGPRRLLDVRGGRNQRGNTAGAPDFLDCSSTELTGVSWTIGANGNDCDPGLLVTGVQWPSTQAAVTRRRAGSSVSTARVRFDVPGRRDSGVGPPSPFPPAVCGSSFGSVHDYGVRYAGGDAARGDADSTERNGGLPGGGSSGPSIGASGRWCSPGKTPLWEAMGFASVAGFDEANAAWSDSEFVEPSSDDPDSVPYVEFDEEPHADHASSACDPLE